MLALSTFISFIVPLLYILGLAGTSVYLFRKRIKFEMALPFALMAAVLIVFIITALFHNINIGLWITIIASAAFVPLLIADRDRLRTLKDKILTPGFVLFLAIYALLFIVNFSRELSINSDEMMHWGPHVRAMWLLNDFYQTQAHSGIVIHGDYPPAVQLFELMWAKISGGYQEYFLYLAIQVLGLSMILPISKYLNWSKFSKRKILGIIATMFFSIVALPLVFDMNGANFYTTIVLDSVIAFIFAYGLYIAITESDKFRWSTVVRLSIAASFMCITKQTTVLFALLVLLVYVVSIMNSYGGFRQSVQKIKNVSHNWRRQRARILLLLALLLLPLLSMKLWSAQTQGYESPDGGVAVFQLEVSDVFRIPSIIAGTDGNESQQYFSKAYVAHFAFGSTSLNLNMFGWITYAQWVILFIGAMILIGYIYRGIYSYRQIAIITTAIVGGWFVYYFAIYDIFLFGGMNDVERFNIDTTNRYWKTYLLSMLIIVVMLFVNGAIRKVAKGQNRPLYTSAVILLLLWGVLFGKASFEELKPYVLYFPSKDSSQYYNFDIKLSVDKITDVSGGTFDQPAKILVTGNEVKGNTMAGLRRHQLQYVALPNRIKLLNPNIDSERACSAIRSQQYLLLDYLGDDDRQLVSQCVSNEAEIDWSQGSMYKIITDNNHTTLVAL